MKVQKSYRFEKSVTDRLSLITNSLSSSQGFKLSETKALEFLINRYYEKLVDSDPKKSGDLF